MSSESYREPLSRRQMALEDVPAAARDLGFGAVEIDDTHLRATSHFRQHAYDMLMERYFGKGAFYRAYTSARLLGLHAAFEDCGTRLAAWTVHTDFTLTGRVARWQMNSLEGAIAAADDFGARLVCIQAGGSDEPSEAEFANCLEGLRQATALAAEFHTRLALENGRGITRSTQRTVRLLQGVDSPNLGVCLRMTGNDCADLAPYAIHVHARAQAFDSQGRETSTDYAACLAALRAVQYRGWIVVSYEGDGDPTYSIMQTAELIGASTQ